MMLYVISARMHRYCGALLALSWHSIVFIPPAHPQASLFWFARFSDHISAGVRGEEGGRALR